MQDTQNNKKIVFTFISLYDQMALGIRYLCSVLEEENCEYNIIFLKKHLHLHIESLPTSEEVEMTIKLIQKLDTDFVGITVYSSFFDLASKITTAVKERLGLPVLWGGPHATVCPEECIKYADIVFIGESENTLKEFIKKIREKNDISTILGTWSRQGNNVYKNEGRQLEQNLDLLPFPVFKDKNTYLIENNTITHFNNWEFYTIAASRGCPFSCTFCSNSYFRNLYSNKGSYVRQRGVRNVIDELIYIKDRFPIKHISFQDEVFFFNDDWLNNFCCEYKEKIKNPFSCLLNPNYLSKKKLILLKEAGLVYVGMGIQSGSEKILYSVYNRHTPIKTIIEATTILDELCLKRTYDILLDNPYDTEETLNETLNLLLQIPKPYDLFTFSLVYLPKTDLTKRMLDEGTISESQVEGRNTKGLYHWRILPTHSLRRMDLYWNNMIKLTGKRYFPNFIIRNFKRSNFVRNNPKVINSFIFLTGLISKINLVMILIVTNITKIHKMRVIDLKKLLELLFRKSY